MKKASNSPATAVVEKPPSPPLTSRFVSPSEVASTQSRMKGQQISADAPLSSGTVSHQRSAGGSGGGWPGSGSKAWQRSLFYSLWSYKSQPLSTLPESAERRRWYFHCRGRSMLTLSLLFLLRSKRITCLSAVPTLLKTNYLSLCCSCCATNDSPNCCSCHVKNQSSASLPLFLC